MSNTLYKYFIIEFIAFNSLIFCDVSFYRSCEYISKVAPLAGIKVSRDNQRERQIELIMALQSQDSLNVIMRIPKVKINVKLLSYLSTLTLTRIYSFQMTLSSLAVRLPIALPVERDGSIPALRNVDISTVVDKWINEIRAEYFTY